MAFGGDRHTKRHNRGRSARLGHWQRALLMRGCVVEDDKPGTLAEVRWQPLLRELAKDDESKKTAMRNALGSLATRKLVCVTYYGGGGTKAKSYRLTAWGYEVALELREHGGKTRASARREGEAARTDPAVEARRKWTIARQKASELLLDDPALISELTRLLGPDPRLGGGSPLEEAAKRFLLLARPTFLQDYARMELERAKDVLGAPDPPGEHVVGVEFALQLQGPFDINDPLFNAELDMVRSLMAAERSADVPEDPGDETDD